MKRSLLLVLLAALSVGCDVGPQLRGAQQLSTEPTTWLGNPGTAVTIRFATGTEQLKGAGDVAFRFGHRGPYGPGKKQGEFWGISDFTVPVMKLEPRAVTLFFGNSEIDSNVLSQLPEQIRAGTLGVVPCDPSKVCG
jgi:hypothetical protein